MASAIDSDATDTEGPVYHIVCHDCEMEGVSNSESEAAKETETHRTETGHNVELGVLTESVSESG